jgi:hypothetical protein
MSGSNIDELSCLSRSILNSSLVLCARDTQHERSSLACAGHTPRECRELFPPVEFCKSSTVVSSLQHAAGHSVEELQALTSSIEGLVRHLADVEAQRSALSQGRPQEEVIEQPHPSEPFHRCPCIPSNLSSSPGPARHASWCPWYGEEEEEARLEKEENEEKEEKEKEDVRHIHVHAPPPLMWLLPLQLPRHPPASGPWPRRPCSEPTVGAHGEGEGVEGRERQAPDAGAELVEETEIKR